LTKDDENNLILLTLNNLFVVSKYLLIYKKDKKIKLNLLDKTIPNEEATSYWYHLSRSSDLIVGQMFKIINER
jgi:hypothetical protein